MFNYLGVPAHQKQPCQQANIGAVVLSAVSFYPELVSGSLDYLNCFLEILKRVQHKKDAAAITHANLIILKSYSLKI